MNKLVAVVAVLALCGAVTLAGQVDNKTYTVPVTVNIAKEVSMWAGGPIVLTLNGKNAENSDAAAGTITHINNVETTISVMVTGNSAGALTDTNFFIFNGGSPAQAIAAMHADANAPAGALKWTAASLVTPVPQSFTTVAKAATPVTLPVVYAADAPNRLPDPAAYDLTVTWTIAMPS